MTVKADTSSETPQTPHPAYQISCKVGFDIYIADAVGALCLGIGDLVRNAESAILIKPGQYTV